MSLDEQVLAALRRALREDRLEAADHLWKAAEALVAQYESDPAAQCRVSLEEIDRVISKGLRPNSFGRSVQRKRLRHAMTKH